MAGIEQSPQAVIEMMWWITLGIGLVVALVVAGLLAWIYREAAVILERVAEIWNIGQRVANNTVHIPLLLTTNAIAARILGHAKRVLGASVHIEQHAQKCPGCPQCLARL